MGWEEMGTSRAWANCARNTWLMPRLRKTGAVAAAAIFAARIRQNSRAVASALMKAEGSVGEGWEGKW